MGTTGTGQPPMTTGNGHRRAAIVVALCLCGGGVRADGEACRLLVSLEITSASMQRLLTRGGEAELRTRAFVLRRELEGSFRDLERDVAAGGPLGDEALYLSMLIGQHRALVAPGGAASGASSQRMMEVGRRRLREMQTSLRCGSSPLDRSPGPTGGAERGGGGGREAEGQDAGGSNAPAGAAMAGTHALGVPRRGPLVAMPGLGLPDAAASVRRALGWGLVALLLAAPLAALRYAGIPMAFWRRPGADAGANKRASQRVDCNLDAELELDGRTEQTRIVNIATGGCGFFAPERLKHGDEVVIRLAGLVLHAEVRWRGVQTAGVKFVEPLTEEQVDGLLT